MMMRLRRRLSRRDRGAVAIVTAILMLTFLGLTAFAVDVGNWYAVGLQAQRAADAGALAGVVNLPGDQSGASSVARSFTKQNGFTDGVGATVVTAGVGTTPTRLNVKVSKSVPNFFGSLLGVRTTTVTRSAVADYAAPVAMGSPCNEFGNDPDATALVRGSTCDNTAGHLWTNINSPSALKENGDSYQSKVCRAGVDGCSGGAGPNTDYRPDGYFYTVSVKQAMASLDVQLFDPAFAYQGAQCNGGDGTAFDYGGRKAVDARNSVVTDQTTRYAPGATDYCTGDSVFANTTPMSTKFTLRSAAGNAWDPLSHPVLCTKTYPGYYGVLYDALNEASPTYNAELAKSFRRWSSLCPTPVSPAPAGDYLLQVQSNVGGTPDTADGGNRFSMRATGSNNNAIAISGRENMGIFANRPDASGNTEFYLARVPSGAAGQVLNIRLFDVGDSPTSGTIKIVDPSGGTYAGCKGSGVANGDLANCSFYVPAGTPASTFNGKWQQVSVPIPTTYTCVDSDATACWVRLQYNYGVGAGPTDVTTWTANIEGDPVRLVQ